MSKFSESFIFWLNGFTEAIGKDKMPTQEQWELIKERCRDEATAALES